MPRTIWPDLPADDSQPAAGDTEVNASHLVALVRAGAYFARGRLVERAELAA